MSRSTRGATLIELLIVVVVLVVVMGLVSSMLVRVQRDYASQRQLMEATDNARAALDMIVRLVRMSGCNPRHLPMLRPIDPDPDGNHRLDSIRIQADWNPPDGALDDPYEDVTFFVQDGKLMKREPGDPPEGVEFAAGIASLSFLYSDAGGNPVADPIATPGAIFYVEVHVQVRLDQRTVAALPLTLTSGAAIRRH